MSLKATDQVLICLTDGEKSMADIVFELDFRPSTVYNAVTHHVASGYIRAERPGKRGRYMLTDSGMERATAIGSAWRQSIQMETKVNTVLSAIIAGCETYPQIVDATGLTRIEVGTAIAKLKQNHRITRTDPAGDSGRGGKTVARFALCR